MGNYQAYQNIEMEEYYSKEFEKSYNYNRTIIPYEKPDYNEGITYRGLKFVTNFDVSDVERYEKFKKVVEIINNSTIGKCIIVDTAYDSYGSVLSKKHKALFCSSVIYKQVWNLITNEDCELFIFIKKSDFSS